MINIKRTDSNNPDFIALVKELDAYLKVIDGEEHAFYKQFNNIDVLKHTVVLYSNTIPVACGAFKPFDEKNIEIKRMYTEPG
ncbi:MAG: GNAT family N-acetyltransferase, partial [Flavobacteriaceae bacterium]|nr:GNAT family N-acetyltransferase [Flavobacteriaceae bacterium]